MIETIKNVGQVIRKSKLGKELDFVSLTQKARAGGDGEDPYEIILDVNICNGSEVKITTRAFTSKVYREGLLTFLGSGATIGSLVLQDKYEKEKKSKKTKAETTKKPKGKDEKEKDEKDKEILRCLEFMDIETGIAGKVRKAIDDKIQEISGAKYVILFLKDGKKPVEIQAQKYENILKTKDFKFNESAGICHLCNTDAQARYDSCGYYCYTNDKLIYTNTGDLSFAVCENCITDIIYGKYFANEYLTTWWAGSSVMFLPDGFDDKIRRIFLRNGLSDNESEPNLLRRISKNENEVFRHIGNSGRGFDLVFFKTTPGKSDWKITYQIQGVKSSRFTTIANLKDKYRSRSGNALSLKQVMRYLMGEKGTGSKKKKGIFTTNEAKRYLSDILHGREINRNLFFSRTMSMYRHDYHQDNKSMTQIHRTYNFLVDCGCLERGWKMALYEGVDNVSNVYKTVDEFFDINSTYFNSNTKKGWFLLGKLYGAVIWESKQYYKKGSDSTNGNCQINDQANDQASKQNPANVMEKSFFFGRQFDFQAFVVIANKCSDQILKYGVSNKRYLKELSSQAKELIGTNDDKRLSPDEAKYIFFWGMSQWFEGEDKEGIDEENKEKEEEDEEKAEENKGDDE